MKKDEAELDRVFYSDLSKDLGQSFHAYIEKGIYFVVDHEGKEINWYIPNHTGGIIPFQYCDLVRYPVQYANWCNIKKSKLNLPSRWGRRQSPTEKLLKLQMDI